MLLSEVVAIAKIFHCKSHNVDFQGREAFFLHIRDRQAHPLRSFTECPHCGESFPNAGIKGHIRFKHEGGRYVPGKGFVEPSVTESAISERTESLVSETINPEDVELVTVGDENAVPPEDPLNNEAPPPSHVPAAPSIGIRFPGEASSQLRPQDNSKTTQSVGSSISMDEDGIFIRVAGIKLTDKTLALFRYARERNWATGRYGVASFETAISRFLNDCTEAFFNDHGLDVVVFKDSVVAATNGKG